MIIYEALASEFSSDVNANAIESRILANFRSKAGISASQAEVASWRNSLMYMNNALMGAGIPDDAGVAIEYRVPQTSKRVDFLLTGRDEAGADTAIIVELKQWTEARATAKDAVVETFLGGRDREVLHPSYQAWTYAALIRDFNDAAHDDQIKIRPCAYLHNMTSDLAVRCEQYAPYLEKAPLFVRDDSQRLQQFLARYIRKGDRKAVLYQIEHGTLRPSKSLADQLVSMLDGNQEFKLIDDQKLIFEEALARCQRAQRGTKQVVVVEGGPGTGKSVVSINLLVTLTKQGLIAQYVTRNAAPRAVYESKLTGSLHKTHFGNLFRSSGGYVDSAENDIDALIVDEAHRLNEKSAFYGNLGTNQIAEIIRAARFSIFFVDDDQRVTLKDIGEKAKIVDVARQAGARVFEATLESQFRCNGSDGYLAWINHVLDIRPTATTTLEGIDYEFHVCGSPIELRDRIYQRNKLRNKSRMVAGYCWDWKGKKDDTIKDVVIPEHGFEAKWNLDKDGGLWILMPDSVTEVGCIHTCQGLELDYVGVIIGPDLVVRNGRVITDAKARSSQDRSIRGHKTMAKDDPEGTATVVDRIIKNTYRTLMTRGLKGCYVFCTDAETNQYLKDCAGFQTETAVLKVAEPGQPLNNQ